MRWHRYLGLAGVVFILILAVTGLMLNHTELLKLDSRYVESEWLLDWYNIEAPKNTVSYAAGDHWITQLGDRIYFDDRRLPGLTGTLTGALKWNDILVIGLQESIVLATPQGQIIERIDDANGVPAGIRQFGADNTGNLLVDTAQGKYYSAADLSEWQLYTGHITSLSQQKIEIIWAKPQQPPQQLTTEIDKTYRTTILPLERVVLDIHGGPFIGPWGRYLVDVVGVLFIVLALFGLWSWVVRQWRQNPLKK
jgi:hypothetical protein